EVGMQPVGECGDAEAAITFPGENGRREPALVAGEIEADEGAERIEILFRLPERGGVALRRLLALLVFGTDAPAVARADRVDEDEIREGEPGFVVLYQRSRIGRDAAAFAELYAARPHRAEVQVGRGSARTAIEDEGDRPFRRRCLRGVGHVEHAATRTFLARLRDGEGARPRDVLQLPAAGRQNVPRLG